MMRNTVRPLKSMHMGPILKMAVALALLNSVTALPADAPDPTNPYFTIRVVDGQTNRGVPLIELRTTNCISHYTDSHGIVAFREPGLMDQEVFFFVEGHGYEFAKDGFGFQGVRLRTTPGTTATVLAKRVNAAERLYRVTGQGIYRDSILTGQSVPLKHPNLNGQVVGQDSVFTCLYRDRIFWMWGDTGRPSYPLGNFGMSGAFSDVPGRGGLDPSMGVDLEYFVGEDGFSRKMAPLNEPGLVWLDGLITVKDRQGHERMVAKYARLKDLGTVLERGLMVFNDATNTFEAIVRPGLEFLPYRNTGHAFSVTVKGQPYYYFTSPSPMGARLRVRARWEDVIDANQYEAMTALVPNTSAGENPRWVTFGDIQTSIPKTKAAIIEALEREAERVHVYDVQSGQSITPHNGTVYYNPYRQRWIGIFVQHFGSPSVLGEVWYAEADTPVGPWVYGRKIVTHNKYSFYNPKHHVLFDQDGGRTIYFEGTYSHTFSGIPENATPRYDYNQIMYRLHLDDPRLALPTPVYHMQSQREISAYLLRDAVAEADAWEHVESIPFCAVEPGRGGRELIGIYAMGRPMARLSTECPSASSKPLFLALPVGETQDENTAIVNLYEYRHGQSDRYLYSTESQLEEKDWKRAPEPLCRVWRMSAGPILIDPEGQAPRI